MTKFFLFFNTIKYLKWQQIYFRIRRRFFKPKFIDDFKFLEPTRQEGWKHTTLYKSKIDSTLVATFLNKSVQLNSKNLWNIKSASKLWNYNLHYFDDLLCENGDKKKDLHLWLLNQWIDKNPIGYGVGWEPYPTSLRIVNILKAWLGGLDLNREILESVYFQACYLSNDLEKHLLGNHYFTNLKALIFAGVVFNKTEWIKIAELGLLNEIPEQILEDGANFELSPMYHSLMLVDMLDMFNLSKAYPKLISHNLIDLLEEHIPKMLKFMNMMSHPDDGLSFFNDSVNGISPPKKKIEKYAEIMGFHIEPIDVGDIFIEGNTKTGYFSAQCGSNKLLFDAAPIGPDYIPGHAHADTLSIEMSIGKQRVFVNSGISEYIIGPKRINQRKTKSHNTVEIDRRDSSEVWSSFRVAKRARIVRKSAEILNEKIILQAAHDGYKKIFGGCIHSRELTFSNSSLVVSDTIVGSFKIAQSRFYFHPSLSISFEKDLLRVEGHHFVLQSDFTGKRALLKNSYWYPEFGVEVPNKVIEVQFEGCELETIFRWFNK